MHCPSSFLTAGLAEHSSLPILPMHEDSDARRKFRQSLYSPISKCNPPPALFLEHFTFSPIRFLLPTLFLPFRSCYSGGKRGPPGFLLDAFHSCISSLSAHPLRRSMIRARTSPKYATEAGSRVLILSGRFVLCEFDFFSFTSSQFVPHH